MASSLLMKKYNLPFSKTNVSRSTMPRLHSKSCPSLKFPKCRGKTQNEKSLIKMLKITLRRKLCFRQTKSIHCCSSVRL
jgi:hypothetical protein